MKKTLAIVLAVAGLSVSGTAFAQAADTDNKSATTSVTILRPLTLTKDADLVFGRVVQPRTGNDTVTIANNSNTTTVGGTAVVLGGITTSRAAFTASGEGGAAITVTVPATASLTSGANSLTVTLDPAVSGSTTLSGSAASAGTKTIDVGGHFTLGSGQASGAYTGSFTVTVAYN